MKFWIIGITAALSLTAMAPLYPAAQAPSLAQTASR